jgi:hypothetical protein
MEVYLSVASFVYILRRFGRDFSLINDFVIALWLPNAKSYQFSISGENRKPTDCGYIPTDRDVLGDMFSESEFKTIMEKCLREHNTKNNTIKHCSINENPGSYGGISTTVNNRIFNCLYR